ncbi:MAG: hypothetical protein WKF75_07485 [Singulisphaera sp.]
MVPAVPSREGLEVARDRIRDYLGWEDVQSQLKDQDVDLVRRETLAANLETSKKKVPEAVQQAYNIVVTVSEANEVHAFKLTINTANPLFDQIKADSRSRIQETAVSYEALLPGGPYDLWRSGETRRVKDLVGAFAQFHTCQRCSTARRSSTRWSTGAAKVSSSCADPPRSLDPDDLASATRRGGPEEHDAGSGAPRVRRVVRHRARVPQTRCIA